MSEPFDDTAKAFYRRLLGRLGWIVAAQLQVYARGRAIDLVAWAGDPEADAHTRGTIFSHFRRVNALEFKGPADPLDLSGYNLVMMRAWGLGALPPRETSSGEDASEEEDRTGEPSDRPESLLPGERTVTIVCVTRPDRILDDLREEMRFFPTEEPGVYFCDERMPQWIIHPTELGLAPRNYPLLPLARGEKLRQFIEVCAREGLTDYLQLVLDVGLATDPVVVWQKILEVMGMKLVLPEETYRDIDEFLRRTPDVRKKIPWADEVIREGVQEGIRRAEEEIQRRTEEEIQRRTGEEIRRAEEENRLRADQETLLRQLRRKFRDVPDDVVRRIEATRERETLGEWLDRIVDARTLAEMGFDAAAGQ